MEFFENIGSILRTIQIRDVIDILAIALLIFGIFRLIRETRAIQLLKGILLLLIVYFIASTFNFVMLSSLLRLFFEASVVIIAIIFQPEIRKALEQMGRNKTWRRYLSIFTKPKKSDEWENSVKKAIVDAADTSVIFSRSRTGALIVFERETMLSDIAATGTVVNAETSVALFGNIFFNKAPLHDGASMMYSSAYRQPERRYQPRHSSQSRAGNQRAQRRGRFGSERGNGSCFAGNRRFARTQF